MITVGTLFHDQLEMTEIAGGKHIECKLTCPGVVMGSKGYTAEEIRQWEKETGLMLPTSFIDFYTEVKKLRVMWSIYENKDGKRMDDSAQFKNDEWLQVTIIAKAPPGQV